MKLNPLLGSGVNLLAGSNRPTSLSRLSRGREKTNAFGNTRFSLLLVDNLLDAANDRVDQVDLRTRVGAHFDAIRHSKRLAGVDVRVGDLCEEQGGG